MGWGSSFAGIISSASARAASRCGQIAGALINPPAMNSAESLLEGALYARQKLCQLTRWRERQDEAVNDGRVVVRSNTEWKYEKPLNPVRWTSAETLALKNRAYRSLSTCCEEKRRSRIAESDLTIIYVNGIRTNEQQHEQTLREIGSMTCVVVMGIYNATKGFLRDALDTGSERRLASAAFSAGGRPNLDGYPPTVKTLIDVLFNESMKGDLSTIEIWAHSEGGAIVAQAVQAVLIRLASLTENAPSLEKLRIRTFGSAAPLWPAGPQCEHYIHRQDFVPLFFGLGAGNTRDQECAGNPATVHRFVGHIKDNIDFTDHKGGEPAPKWTEFHDVRKIYFEAYMNRQSHCNIE